MRLFIGTTIPDQAADRIERAATEQLMDPSWRIAPRAQWHVTALFIGERPEQDRSRIEAEMTRISSATDSFKLVNGRLCTMPMNDPRMLWVRFDPSDKLSALHMRLAQAVDAEPSRHIPFTPHITLARSRGKVGTVNGPIIIPELVLDHLALFRTELHPSGSIHYKLANQIFS